eukprot:gene856-9105_t
MEKQVPRTRSILYLNFNDAIVVNLPSNSQGENDEILQDYIEIFKKNGLFTLKRWSKLPVEHREKIVTNQVSYPIPLAIANYLDEMSGIKVKNYF